MDETGKAHTWDVAGGAVDAFKVPNRLGSIQGQVSQARQRQRIISGCLCETE